MKQKVSIEKTEQRYGVKDHRKYAIGGSNAPTLCWCCCCLYHFGDVADTIDNCVKIKQYQ